MPNQNKEDHPDFAEITTSNDTLETFSDVDVKNWSGPEDVNISVMEFNRTFSSVLVDNAGYGYSVPVELKVIGGLPQYENNKTEPPLPEYNSSNAYSFQEAKFKVSEINSETGKITDLELIDGGFGYVSYQDLDPNLYPYNTYPMISVSGGGGKGAVIQALDADKDGVIDDFRIIDGGVGYFNIDSDNYPTAKHSNFDDFANDEKNATLEVRLGGYLEEISRCTLCEQGAHDKAGTPNNYSHLEPWIEIWDRGRSEEYIDQIGDRAHAAPKVVDGKINKVVVTKSGRGYVDPVAYVRDIGPKQTGYYADGDFRRKWKCTFSRITDDGKKIECGHVHWSLYPPDYCPGETDTQFPYQDENGTIVLATGDQVEAWKKRFNALKENSLNKEDENTTYHLNARFLSRKCWAQKPVLYLIMMRLTGIQEVTGYILMQTCRSYVKMERLSKSWLKTAVQIIMPRKFMLKALVLCGCVSCIR